MKNILINWVLPTTRQLGGPLPVEEIDHVSIELSADAGASYALVGDFTPDVLSAPVNDLPVSDQYVVRGHVVDTGTLVGDYTETAFVIADDSAPGVLEITVVIQ